MHTFDIMKDMNYYRDAGPTPPILGDPPRLEDDATPQEIRIYADRMEAYQAIKASRLAAVKLYNKRKADLEEEFKNDALEHVGLANHPKKDKIYSYAWEQGHAYGFEEVLSTLNELSHLFVD
jgi:hypothetical protein